MAIVLISTTDAASQRQSEFLRFIESLTLNGRSCPSIRSYILVQNARDDQLSSYRKAAPAFCHFTSSPSRISLSAARNALLSKILAENSLTPHDVVGFPDDDCWFPDQLLSGLARAFESRRNLDVLVCRVSLNPADRPLDSNEVLPAKARHIVRLSSSNNMFFRGSLIEGVGLFDTSLGVGTPIGGAEDTDYVIRATLVANEVGFVDQPLVGHREPDVTSTARYYHGGLAVLSRYALRRPSLLAEFVRKIFVGFYLIARGRLSPRMFQTALLMRSHSLKAGAVTET